MLKAKRYIEKQLREQCGIVLNDHRVYTLSWTGDIQMQSNALN